MVHLWFNNQLKEWLTQKWKLSSFTHSHVHSKPMWLSLFCRTQKEMFSRVFTLLFMNEHEWELGLKELQKGQKMHSKSTIKKCICTILQVLWIALCEGKFQNAKPSCSSNRRLNLLRRFSLIPCEQTYTENIFSVFCPLRLLVWWLYSFCERVCLFVRV